VGNADIWMHGRPDFRPAPLQRTGSDCFGGPSQGGCGIMVAAWEGVIWRTGPEVSGEGDRRRVRARLPARSARHSAGRRRVCVHSLQGAAQVIGRTARVCLGVCVHSLQGAAQVIGRTARVCLGVCVHSLQGAAQVIGRTARVCLGVCVHSLQGAAQVIGRTAGVCLCVWRKMGTRHATDPHRRHDPQGRPRRSVWRVCYKPPPIGTISAFFLKKQLSRLARSTYAGR